MNAITKAGLTALIAYSSHFSVTKLYNVICIRDGIYGFIEGLMTAGSPLCSSLLTVMTYTQVTYSTLLVTSITRILVDIVNTLKFEKKES
jgi:hypothetical protein